LAKEKRTGTEQIPLPTGQWLYKIHDEVYGPSSARIVVEHMLRGEVDENSQLAKENGPWKTVGQMGKWHPHLKRAKAILKTNRARAEAEARARRSRHRKISNLCLASLALGIIGFGVAYLLVVKQPWGNEEALLDWSNRHVPVVGTAGMEQFILSQRVDDDLGGINIDDILVADAPDLVAVDQALVKRKPGKSTTKNASSKAAYEPVSALSRQEIQAKVYAISNRRNLAVCLKAEARRNPASSGRVVLSFSIRNEGQVHNVQLDDPRLEEGPLHNCFRQKLSRLKFRAYSGQVQNVTIPLDWKR
jgi:hypothetical protein